ncbi:MAG: DUF1385 domain-containing protein [Chitinispirillaceae bacterium]|nr:DUF1385 domain-containing protein [Chitinispirillaceae bacterium]
MKNFLIKLLSFPYLLMEAPHPKRVGGQAIIEGVMMRGPESVSWAVRKNEKEIVVEKHTYISASKKYPLLSKPILRGFVSLIESLHLGYWSLNRSAEIIEEEQKKEKKEELPTQKDKKINNLLSGATLVLSLGIALGIFMYLPMWILSKFISKDSAILFNTLAGILRIFFLLAYIILIGLMKDVKRVFEYHGAEHKAIHTYENGLQLSIDNMQKFPTLHPRCGTAFLLIVGIICIFLFAIFDAIFITFVGPYPSVLIRFIIHLLFIPLISGTSFEILKLSDRFKNNSFVKFLILPGLYLQKLTTKKPDDSQLEVAATALKAIL